MVCHDSTDMLLNSLTKPARQTAKEAHLARTAFSLPDQGRPALRRLTAAAERISG